MAGVASQEGDADSSRAPGLTSGFQGSIGVYFGNILFMSHSRCINTYIHSSALHLQCTYSLSRE